MRKTRICPKEKRMKYRHRRLLMSNKASDADWDIIIKTYSLTSILKHNLSDKVKEICEIKRVCYNDFCVLSTRYAKTKSIEGKQHINQLMLYFLLYHNMTSLEISNLLIKLALSGCWYVVDYFHALGYRQHNKHKIIDIAPYFKVNELLKLGYTISINRYLLLIRRKKLTYEGIVKILEKYKNDTKKYNKLVNTIIKLYDATIVDKLIKCKLIQIDKIKMDDVCNSHNTSMVKYLVDNGKHMTLQNLRNLLGIKTLHRNKRSRRMWGRRRYFMQWYGVSHCVLKKIIKSDAHNGDVIGELVSKFGPELITKFPKYFISIKNIKVFDNVKHNINIHHIICEVKKLIRKDDIETIRSLIQHDIIKVYEFSKNSYFMDYALVCDSHKCLRYFHDDLCMSFSRMLFNRFYGSMCPNSEQTVTALKYGFPMNNAFKKYVCSRGFIDVLSNVSWDFKQSDMYNALIHKHVKFAIVLAQKGCYYDNTLLYGILRNICVSNNFGWWMRRRYRISNSSEKSQYSYVKYLIDIFGFEGTFDCCNLLIENGMIGLYDYFCDKFNVWSTYSGEILMNKLFSQRRVKTELILNVIKYFDKNNIDVATGNFDVHRIGIICGDMNVVINVNLICHICKKNNIKLGPDKFIEIMRHITTTREIDMLIDIGLALNDNLLVSMLHIKYSLMCHIISKLNCLQQFSDFINNVPNELLTWGYGLRNISKLHKKNIIMLTPKFVHILIRYKWNNWCMRSGIRRRIIKLIQNIGCIYNETLLYLTINDTKYKIKQHLENINVISMPESVQNEIAVFNVIANDADIDDNHNNENHNNGNDIVQEIINDELKIII